jgi:hypothetical protein
VHGLTKIKIIKITMLAKEIYRFSAITIKILIPIILHRIRTILRLIRKHNLP